jgi:hypothetical protein
LALEDLLSLREEAPRAEEHARNNSENRLLDSEASF